VSERSSRRRLRLRRKRKGEIFASKLSETGEIAKPSRTSSGFGAGDAAEVVGHMGCCVVEAVGSLAVLLALLTVPAYLLMR
jgi:hypothetical protein